MSQWTCSSGRDAQQLELDGKGVCLIFVHAQMVHDGHVELSEEMP